MPELPEVETIVNGLKTSGLVGRVIRDVRVYWRRIIAGRSVTRFIRQLRGKRITGINRRGKYLVVSLSSGQTLLVHLRMTGQFAFASRGACRDRHEHVILRLDDERELRYRDTRKFGRWLITQEPEKVLSGLGPEPLDAAFSFSLFTKRLSAHGRQIKPLLLDQSWLAGLGNIYADEVLWEARLHPKRRSDTLADAEQKRLYKAVRTVLRRAIRHCGTSLGTGLGNYRRPEGDRGRHQDALRVFRRTGGPCFRCGASIIRLTIAQRSSHICPACQPLNTQEEA